MYEDVKEYVKRFVNDEMGFEKIEIIKYIIKSNLAIKNIEELSKLLNEELDKLNILFEKVKKEEKKEEIIKLITEKEVILKHIRILNELIEETEFGFVSYKGEIDIKIQELEEEIK